MNLNVSINGKDITAYAKLFATTVDKDLSGYNSTSTLAIDIDESNSARFGTARFGRSKFSWTVKELDEVLLTNSSGDQIFGGTVADISYEMLSPDLVRVGLSCQDYGSMLDKVIINQTWTNKTDRQIVKDIVALLPAGYSAIDANVGQFITLTYTAKDLSARRILQDLAEQAGAEFRVDAAKAVHYFKPSARPAPFALSSNPDFVTSFDFQMSSGGYKRSFPNAANKITYLGGAYPLTGNELSVTVQDTDSQAKYGVRAITIVDREIIDPVILQLTAQAELAKRAWPDESVALTIRKDGLEVGMALPITSTVFGFSGTYTVRRLRMTWMTNTVTQWDVEAGDYRPNLERVLDLLLDRSRESTILPVATPPDGSITTAKLADGAVDGLKIAAQAVDSTKIAVGAVTNSILALGAVTSTKIADDAITTPKIATNAIIASKIGAGEIIAGKLGAQAVYGSNIAAGTITALNAVFASGAIQTADIGDLQVSTLKVAGFAINAAKLADLCVSTPKIVDNAVTSLKLSDLSVTTAKINDLSVTQGKIANLAIGSAQIQNASISWSMIQTANILAAHIADGNITTAKIQDLAVTNAKMASLSVGTANIVDLSVSTLKIGGYAVDNSKLANSSVGTSNIVGGSVGSGQIATGGVTGTNIQALSITSAHIQDLAVTSAKIGSISADKITAGTINASVSISSGNFMRVYSGGTYYSEMQGAQITVNSNGGSAYMYPTSFYCADAAGDSAQLSGNGLSLRGTRVVYYRQSGPGVASFASLADAANWCNNLATALRNHGLIT